MKRVLVFGFLIALTACSTLSLKSEKSPDLIYRLETPGGGCADSKAPGKILDVTLPEIPAGFDTDRIAIYLDRGRRLDYAAAARWPDKLDEMLQRFIISTLNQSCSSLIAQTPRFNMPGAYRLVVKMRDFEAVYAETAQKEVPELLVAGNFTLVSLPDGNVLADFTLAKKSRSRVNSLTAITAGLEGLLRDMIAEARSRMIYAANSKKEP